MGGDQKQATTQAQKTLEVTRQLNEVPQTTVAPPQQLEEHRDRFAQPGHLQGTAPAPQMAEPVQQQQLSRKERRKLQKEEERQRKEQERQQRERAKRMAQAKLQVDNLVQQMKANPIPGEPATDYEGVRPTELFMDRGELLERVVLTHISDHTLARDLLDEVRVFQNYAASFDKMSHDLRFRTQCVPAYIEEVLQQRVSQEVDAVLERELDAFSEANYYSKVTEAYDRLEAKILQHLTDDQKKLAKGQSKGEDAEAYQSAIEQIMEREHISRRDAKQRYAEDALRRKKSAAPSDPKDRTEGDKG